MHVHLGRRDAATTVNATGGTCSANHTYAAAGVYTVTVTVKDDDTGSDTETFSTFIVIYDPGAGFVTGGGWINVTAGSCRLTTVCEGATGKANFGFVSKYKKGASVPTARPSSSSRPATSTSISEAYEWLVVAVNKAQYRGTGTINGSRLRLPAHRLTTSPRTSSGSRSGGYSDNVVVFDSRMGASDDIDTANPQGIAGGSIVIHNK